MQNNKALNKNFGSNINSDIKIISNLTLIKALYASLKFFKFVYERNYF